MKNFLAVYTGSESGFEAAGWKSLSEDERKAREQAGMKEWGDWVKNNENSIKELGGPVGKTKSISKQGIADIRNNIAGYTVVQAESHEQAAKLFINHPHFALFPGDSVEVMECLPVPAP